MDKNFYRSLQNRITPDFRWIDNVFSGGMMRSRSEHSSRFLPMTIYTRPVQMLLCGLLLLTTAIAVLNTLVPLWLAHENMPTWQVGMVGSSYFTGNPPVRCWLVG